MSELSNVLNTASRSQWDVIVYGATEAGAIAARSAAEQGARTLLISDSDRVGCMSGWGITHQDVTSAKSPASIGGRALRFFTDMARAETAYKSFPWYWRKNAGSRPGWYQRAWSNLIDHKLLTVIYDAPLVSLSKGVNAKGDTVITSITCMVAGVATTFAAEIFVEGSDVGDLNQRALVSKSLGREASTLYGESTAGVRAATIWNGPTDVDPYLTPGVPASGYCFGIDTGALGSVGDGDGRVMGFTYRWFLTSVASEQGNWPVPDPTYFSSANYELLARAMAANPTYYGHATLGLGRIMQCYDVDDTGNAAMGPTYIPYVDLNSGGPLSTNYPLEPLLREYVTATYTRRAEIRNIIKAYVHGLPHWILNSNDARIPAVVKTALAAYKPSARELIKYGGVSPQLYVREGVRAVGDFVLNLNNCTVGNGYPDYIAFGFYDYDSHNVRLIDQGGKVYVEGSQLSPLGNDYGFRVPMRVLLPKRAECANLVCASQPSVSNVVWRSLRVAPSMMMIGDAGGILAGLAARQKCAPHDIFGNFTNNAYRRVMAIQDLLGTANRVARSSDAAVNAGGVVTKTGVWTAASSRFGAVGTTYDVAAAGAAAVWKWQPPIYEAGIYRVYADYAPANSIANGDQGRATNAKYHVSSGGVVTEKLVNQQWPGGSSGGRSECLGDFYFRRGNEANLFESPDYVEVDANGSDGLVTHAAFKLERVG